MGSIPDASVTDAATGLRFYNPDRTSVSSFGPSLKAVMAVEVDSHFVVENGLGVRAGDELLATVSRRMLAVLRDQPFEIRRARGAHFLVGVQVQDRAVLIDTARSLCQIGWSDTGPEGVVDSSISIGIARAEDCEDAGAEMVTAALLALEKTRAERRGSLVFYDASMTERVAAQARIGPALRRAIVNREISLMFQPQLGLHSDNLAGAEVLARWTDPELGPISPGVFVAIAEQIGLGRSLDRLVLEKAVAQLRAWDDAGIVVPRLSVNFSPQTLTSPALFDSVGQILEAQGVSPSRITIEVTESHMVESGAGEEALNRLHDMGFRISLDDFGTGYSSFGQLATLPIDEVKIDQSFVRDPLHGLSVEQAILQVAQTFRAEVVAEGIETELQKRVLAELECHLGQGYLFAKPLRAGDFEEWYRGHRAKHGGGGIMPADTSALVLDDILRAARRSPLHPVNLFTSVAGVRVDADASPEAIFTMDRNLVVRGLNRPAEEMYGIRESDVIGLPISAVIKPLMAGAPYLREEQESYLERVIRGEVEEPFESVRTRADGAVFHVQLLGLPIRDAEGSVVGVVGLVRDITRLLGLRPQPGTP